SCSPAGRASSSWKRNSSPLARRRRSARRSCAPSRRPRAAPPPSARRRATPCSSASTSAPRSATARTTTRRRSAPSTSAASARAQALLDAMAAVDRDAAALARREGALREKASDVNGRLRVLRDMESRMEGLDQGPRWLLQQRPQGLRGSLLDLLDVDLTLGPALEAALGPFAQALVVDTRANAVAIIDDLQRNGRGRALLLVEEEFGVDLDERAHPPLPEGATLLADRAQCAPHARRLL